MNAKMLRNMAILLSIALAGVTFAQEDQVEPEIEPAPTASLAIRVIAEATGEPIAEAKVQVLGGQVGATDPDGICFLDELPARRSRVIVSKEGFATTYQYVNLEPEKESSLKISLDPEGKIVGIVTNDVGEILPDAACSVYAKEGRVASEKADENGLFTIAGLSLKNTYALYISHAEYCTKTMQDVKIPQDTGVLMLEAALGSGGFVRGRVTDPEGRPIQGARVSASSGRDPVETDADGVYVLERVETQKTWVRVSAPNCAPERQEVTPKEEGITANFQLSPGRGLSGRVVGENGNPLPGVSVRAYTSHFGMVGDAQTGANGEFKLDSLPEDKLYLSLRAEGYSDPRTAAWPGQDGLSVTLYRSGHITGQVVDKDGKPVRDFRVFLSLDRTQSGDRQPSYPSKFPYQTGMPVISLKGEFEIKDVTVGAPYRLTIVTRDYAPTTASAVRGSPLDKDEPTVIVVEKGRTFSGKVFDAATSLPVAGAEIILSVQDLGSKSYSHWSRHKEDRSSALPAGSLSCSSGENGVFELNGVAPRPYYVVATHPDYTELSAGWVNFSPSGAKSSREQAYVVVPPPTDTGISGAIFRLGRGATISGHCYGQDGKPMAGARVVLSDSRYTKTNDEGAYQFDKILPGAFSVTFYTVPSKSSKWEGTYWRVSLTVEPDKDAVLDFRPFGGLTLTGRIVGKDKSRKKLRVSVHPDGASSPIIATTPDSKGAFTVTGLQPGRYVVSAISYKERKSDTYARERVNVSEKETANVILRVD